MPTPVVHNDEIHYTASEKITHTWDITVFGANYLPEDSTFDETTHEGILKFDGNVTSIGNYAFSEYSSLISVIIPNNVTSIGYSAFSHCSSLTSVTIGNNVTSIGSLAFYGCNSLNSITIPNSVTSIGNGAFTTYTSNPILNSITFESITPIDLVDQYDSIIRIFGNPDYLVNFAIYVPSGYESIYAEHDAGWETLAPFIVGYVPVVKTDTIFTYSDSTTSTSSDKTISQSSYNRNKMLTSVKIGTKATSIGDNTFNGCSGLTSVTIPNSVTSIGDGAFYSCESLTSLTIPNSVTSIENSTFYGCISLASVTIPNSVTSIGVAAFSGCYSLTSVTIPNSVISIGGNAFWGMSVTASFMSTIPNISLQIGEEIIEPFGGSGPSSEPAEFTIIVPAGCKAAYIAKDAGWEALAAYIEET